MKKINKLIFVFIIVLTLLYALSSKRKILFVEGYIKDAFVQLQKILYYPVTYQDDNNLYHHEISSNLIKELNKEKESLKELLELSYSLTDFHYISATIISRNTTHILNNLIIDKGFKDGIINDSAVISSQGLIGKIINTSKNSSEVKLIINNDVNNKISVQVNNINALISGYEAETGFLYITGINNTENININDAVITNGLGGIYPAGILVGYVTKVTSDKYGVGQKIFVKTIEDFNNIKYIAVLKRRNNGS